MPSCRGKHVATAVVLQAALLCLSESDSFMPGPLSAGVTVTVGLVITATRGRWGVPVALRLQKKSRVACCYRGLAR